MVDYSFTHAPSKINLNRTKFPLSFNRKMTMTAGRLYPIYCEEVVPGDTFQVDISSLIRMATPLHPVMDNCFADIAFFYCPTRIIWDSYTQFMGEPPKDLYGDNTPLSVPQLKPEADPETGEYFPTVPKSLLDYFALPTLANLDDVSALQFRAFCRIWNDWYRAEELFKPIDIPTGDENILLFNDRSRSANDMFMDYDPDVYVFTTPMGGHLPPVAKYHDYFTSALVNAQRGEDVAIPLSGFAPVLAFDGLVNDPVAIGNGAGSTMMLRSSGDYADLSSVYGGSVSFERGHLDAESDGSPGGDIEGLTPSNLAAALGSVGKNNRDILNTYSTINDLRYAFATQKLLEADNLFGTRYTELLYGHYGIEAPSGLLQRTEYLFGKQVPINITQVLQTSESTPTSPQGNTAAYSLTTDYSNGFTKSFVEGGFVIGVCCIRTEHSYQQAVNKQFDRKDRLDYFFPEFENVGDSPILGKEIYNGDENDLSVAFTKTLREYQNSVFGYQERFAEYKYHPNEICGEFRSNYPGGSLDVWHYADYYTEPPYLSTEWLRETRVNIDRTIAVSSDVSDQFLCDFYYKVEATRPMAKYSRPGGLYSRI